jgi:hypothetical protein
MPIQFDNTNTGTFTFKSPTTGGYALTFPSADGTNTQCFKADTSGNLTFAATTGLVVAGFTFALNTAAPNATNNVASISASGAGSNISIALVPKGSGAICFVLPNAGSSGGSRGPYTVDYSVLNAGGTCGGSYDVMVARSSTTASGTTNTVFLGSNQSGSTASATYALDIGGNITYSTSPYIAGIRTSGGTLSNSYITIHNNSDSVRADPILFTNVQFGMGIRVTSTGNPLRRFFTITGNSSGTTPIVLGTEGSAAAPTGTGMMRNPVDGSSYWWGYVIAVDVTSNVQGVIAVWRVTGAIVCNSTVATTVFVGTPTATVVYQAAGATTWTLTTTADTTNGGWYFTFTGSAGTTCLVNGGIQVITTGAA